tara:strand:+ start:162 stop:473 length:312 start_codon:yes stop_codon:yes gene_type:complete
MYLLLFIVLLLIIYDIMISKKDEEIKKNKIKEVKKQKKQEKQEEEKKRMIDPNEDCLYKINDNNDNCTLKNGCFKSNQCKLHVSSIENLHPNSYDWSSLDIKY